MQLTLTSEEASILHEVLDNYVSDLRMEISNTDLMDFRERLKAKKVFLERLISELKA